MVNNIFKCGVSLSILSVLLSGTIGPSWAMNAPDQDEFLSGPQSAPSTPDIDSRALVLHTSRPTPSGILTPLIAEAKGTYRPTQERGVPDWYKTKVTKDEWDHAVAQISFGISSEMPEYDANVVTLCLKDWQSVSNNFYAQYQQLTNVPRLIKKLDINKFKENLFSFVVHFENFYTSLKDNYQAQKKGFAHLNDSFKTFQKAWNGSMKIYQTLTGENLGFFGSLNISREHETYLKHLYYSRDTLGFLIFSIYTHQEVMPGSGIYETYIPYGDIDKSLFNERWVLFRSSPNDPTIELINNRALILNKDEETVTSIEPYFGDKGVVPFSKAYGLGCFADAFVEDEENYKRLVRSQEECARIMNAVTGTEGAVPNMISDEISQSFSFSKAFHKFADKILGAQSKKVIFMPESKLDHMEANYLFLLDLQLRQAKTPEDLDVNYALEWFQAKFPEQTLDEVITECEESLEEAYVNEEKERLEKIQLEQLERSKMVIAGAHTASKKKKNKGKKPQKEASLSLSSRRGTTSSLSKAKIEEQSKDYARAKLKGLKNMRDLRRKTEEIDKTIKYKEYVAMVNVALQELRNLGANITGGLNESSHGALKIDDAVLPLHRPHGPKHNMVYGSSAREMLGELLNMYFEKNAQKVLTEE